MNDKKEDIKWSLKRLVRVYGMHAANGYTITEKNTNELIKKMMGWKWTDKRAF